MWGVFLCYGYVNKSQLSAKIHVSISLLTGFSLITLACLSWDYVILKIVTRDFIPYINLILDAGIFFFTWSLLMMNNNPIKWIFNNYLIQLLGVMCYSIYIWHGLAIKPIILEYDAAQIIEYYCFVFILSALSYRFIEFGYDANWKKLFLLE